jgi:uncharacterized protein
MLTNIKVTPLAAESLGVRSMCTLVETPDVSILLDAGVSLAPYRFGLLPHPIEFHTIARLRGQIAQAAQKANVVTISHYHFDHHTPSYEDWLVNWTQAGETARQIYQDKTVLMKNPKEHINASQRQRGWLFQRTAGKLAKELIAADGAEFKFGYTKVRFSEAVPHGPEGSMLGWVIMTTIGYKDERVMHAPDVQGPMAKRTLEIILDEKPNMIMVGGPPFYLSGFKVEKHQIQQGAENLKAIAEAVPVTIVEHHTLRDELWKTHVQPIYLEAKKLGHSIKSAAEYVGQEDVLLESKRKELYAKYPPSEDFKCWTKLDSTQISRVKPPIQ